MRAKGVIPSAQAGEALYRWLKTVPFLVSADPRPALGAASQDPTLERDAARVVYDLAHGHMEVWNRANADVQGLAALLTLDCLAILTGAERGPAELEAPADLSGAELGAWLIAQEIQRTYPNIRPLRPQAA